MARHPWWILPPAVALLGFVASAWAETEIDPAAVSEGLKAIFKYGSGTKETADRLNANTLTIMSGTIAGTYVQFGADLASALDDGDNLRVLAIIGRGSVQGVADILFLKGVDLGIVRSDTLDYLEKKGYANNIKKQFTYHQALQRRNARARAKIGKQHGRARRQDCGGRPAERRHVRDFGHRVRTVGDPREFRLHRTAARLREAEEGRNRRHDLGARKAIEIFHYDQA